MSKRLGAVPDHMLRTFTMGGIIHGGAKSNIGPASVDLSLSDEVYRIENLFLPRHGEKIRDLLGTLNARKHDIAQPLERGITYLVRLSETLNLIESIYGYCNPKSSVGRNDIHVRVLADGVARYDAVTPAGFSGELWLSITPNSFPILVPPGECLTQLRLFNEDTRFDEIELQTAFRSHTLLFGPDKHPIPYREVKIRDGDGSLLLTLDLGGESGVAGYECRGSRKVLDLGVRTNRVGDFFNPIQSDGDTAYLEAGKFYILSTLEWLEVPDTLAAEVVSMDDRSGEFRSHYAGFVDPGFKGKLTLEVRPYHDIAFRHGQPITKVRFERMMSPPELSYGAKAEKNYQSQGGPRLSKHFGA